MLSIFNDDIIVDYFMPSAYAQRVTWAAEATNGR